MSNYPFDVVPGVALETRYQGRMLIWTPRTSKDVNVNAWFSHIEQMLSDSTATAPIFWCFDFATHAKRKTPVVVTPYFRQRLRKLSAHAVDNLQGRMAVAAPLRLGQLLRPINWDAEVGDHFPAMEVRAFNDRDAAIGWLVTGYERSLLRA